MSDTTFRRIDADSLGVLAELYAANGRRRVAALHLHATRMPSARDYRELAESLGSRGLAGQQVCLRLWRRHTEHRGFVHVGAHLLIDPDGSLWLGRPWDLPPISIRGLNGNLATGPLCIALIGDLEHAREESGESQHRALIVALGGLQQAFDLSETAICWASEVIHQPIELAEGLDSAALRSSIAALPRRGRGAAKGAAETRSSAPTPVGTSGGRGRGSRSGPLGDRQTAEHGLLGALLADGENLAVESRRLEADSDFAEAAVNDLLTELLGPSATRGSRGARAPARPRATIRPEQLRRHVINLRQGEFSDAGSFTTTPADVDRLFDRELPAWIASLPEDRAPKILFLAHGGLTSEERGLEYAARWHRWWLEQGIWPIHFVWESGLLETLMQLLEAGFRGSARGLRDSLSELRDSAVEELAHRLGQDIWAAMKLHAMRASEPQERFGANYTAGKLAALVAAHPKLECHAVGHSAGAVFQAGFLGACRRDDRAVSFRTLSLLAPACTIDLFDAKLRGLVDGERIGRLLLFLLDSRTERADPTVPLYGKSLLHLVSKGLERRRGAAVLGLEDSIRRDPSLADFLGLGGVPRAEVTTILAPSSPDAPPTRRSGATVHGGFDDDAATLISIALEIRCEIDTALVPPVPTDSASRALRPPRLFAPIEERLDEDLLEWFGKSATSGAAHGAASGVATLPVTPNAVEEPRDDGVAPMSMAGAHDGTQPEGPIRAAPSPDSRKRDSFEPSDGQHDGSPARRASARRGDRTALCIGIDGYPGAQALDGCVSDARAWSKALESLGFRSRLLLDGNATYEGIRSVMSQVLESARPGDTVAIQYSGHGIQFPDVDGDEEDGDDEALVPIDNDGRLFLADDELWAVLQSHREGVEVCVFMDCCHSRSNSRALSLVNRKARLIVPDEAMIGAHRARLAARRSVESMAAGGSRAAGASQAPVRSIEAMRHMKFSACADKELAFEEDGQGNFTRAALKALAGLHSPLHYDAARLAFEDAFSPDARQHPGLECPTSSQKSLFLGGAVIEADAPHA